MTVAEVISSREITEVLHFTTHKGLVGCLAKRFLLSRPLLQQEDYLAYVLHLNSETRPEESAYFDKSEDWVSFVNLSISEINRRFLMVSKKWHTDQDIWWAILSFDPIIMTHEDTRFTTTNNSYEDCIRSVGCEGLKTLFAPSIHRKRKGGHNPWIANRASRPDNLPTCEQAEVLYPNKIDLKYLMKIYVENDENYDQAKGWANEFGYDEVIVEINPGKFMGNPN